MKAIERLKELSEKYQREGKVLITEAILEYFESQPTVLGLRWEQGTDSFCDGEPCTFSVRVTVIVPAGSFEDKWGQYEDTEETFAGTVAWFVDEWSDYGREFFEDLTFLWNTDLLKNIYGEFATVTVSRDGTTEATTEYNDHGY